MTSPSPQPDSPPAAIDDLFTLRLVDGLPVQRDGKPIKYRLVKLRETGVADERAATRMAERVVMVGDAPQLLCSPSDFKFAMTLKHIESFHCDTLVLDGPMLDLELLGKLSSHDLGLIEARVFLIEVAAQVRYGVITQAQFQAVLAGSQADKAAPPQPPRQAEALGAPGGADQPGVAVLADFSGEGANGQA
jgi:phage FluMu protein gp41